VGRFRFRAGGSIRVRIAYRVSAKQNPLRSQSGSFADSLRENAKNANGRGFVPAAFGGVGGVWRKQDVWTIRAFRISYAKGRQKAAKGNLIVFGTELRKARLLVA